MATQIFINLAVKDLGKSVDFYTMLGYSFDPRFTDENAACLIVSDTIFAMLLTEDFFRTFIKKPICDANRCTEAILAVSVGSREKVDEFMKKAVAAGARLPREPYDYGFMYGNAYEDPDGHLWEVFCMDVEEYEKTRKGK